MTAQHLVLYLHAVAGVEEFMGAELFVLDPKTGPPPTYGEIWIEDRAVGPSHDDRTERAVRPLEDYPFLLRIKLQRVKTKRGSIIIMLA